MTTRSRSQVHTHIVTTRTNLPVPATPTDLTTTWLTSALRQWGGAGEVTVSVFNIEPLAENRGFYGNLARLRLEYTAESMGAPTTIIAKFSSPVPEMRKRSVDSYVREVRFYQQLAKTVDVPVPECYYAGIDVESGEHVLLLQDLAPMLPGSRIVGCTVDQARLATREIVKLHIAWWGRVDDHALAWLADGDVSPDMERFRQLYATWWPAFYAQAQSQLPVDMRAASEALGEHLAAIRKHTFGSSPRTLIHRDFQLDNLFFATEAGKGGPNKSGEAGSKDFAVVDWQFLSRGRGVWDIAYFLSESLLPEDRRAVEMEALEGYHRTLIEHGITAYSFEQCIIDFRTALLLRHSALVSTLATMPFSEEQRHIHLNILLPRNIAAIRDHDAFALLT